MCECLCAREGREEKEVQKREKRDGKENGEKRGKKERESGVLTYPIGHIPIVKYVRA